MFCVFCLFYAYYAFLVFLKQLLCLLAAEAPLQGAEPQLGRSHRSARRDSSLMQYAMNMAYCNT